MRIDEFADLYNKLLGEKDKVQLNLHICESVARNLKKFDMEKEKYRRLEMTEKLVKRVFESQINLSSQLFDSLVNVFTESQQWTQVIELLSRVNVRNCDPEIKTLNYLKKNLIYCFENQTRGQLKERIEKFEEAFFSKEAAAMRAARAEEEKRALLDRKLKEGKKVEPEEETAESKKKKSKS